ncbi:hypothetical protein HRW18_13265 [Streptomyces lunaelactis]|uniref:hypothetical protein n=1 Tax=Streptomyces lunaelactis TaxID=1535768 RepID=UPI001584EDFC|nr:hypothetical protein [Streptomyces lunaelactis]NUK08958.1 hypothetical protein [Streptomyces lunaelactis]NUK34659.1 hypothetical protein [Streptomyces lunaelactis]NUK41544.1 hypothetical protein [Streptomyces lunaelactis]NUK57798.1 hypothetical protein [Streptomyces lunaelactis]NUK91691.1 hypothetical protein [Streptomyces lunaelactis]
MAADWWARGIAIGGAAVAGLNMTVSYATYRRGRPRVAVLAEAYRIYEYAEPESIPDPTLAPDRYSVSVRLNNNSAAAVTIESVHVLVTHRPTRFSRDTASFGQTQSDVVKLDPMGGTTLEIEVMDFFAHRLAGQVWDARVSAVLSNGREVRSKKLRSTKVLSMGRRVS